MSLYFWVPPRYVNSVRRAAELEPRGILFVGMGVSGGEEGARNGPSLMPGGPRAAFDLLEPILSKCAAQVDDGPCTTYCGPVGSGNYVKMVHNGIEYGDMQLIAEIYDILKVAGGLDNEALKRVFEEWNKGELQSYLVEITATILGTRDTEGGGGYVVDAILDQTGMKGTGRWTVQEAAEMSVPCGTITAALDARYLSARKEERVAAAAKLDGPPEIPSVDRGQLLDDCRAALYSAKVARRRQPKRRCIKMLPFQINPVRVEVTRSFARRQVCSYAQGMELIKAASVHHGWEVDLSECPRIWKGGCIIRAAFLGRIQAAYAKDPTLPNLLVDPSFVADLNARQMSWRRVVTLAVVDSITTQYP